MTIDELKEKKVSDLKTIAKTYGLKGINGLKKEELIEKLMALNSESDSSNIEENSLPSEPNEEILPQEENLPTENVDFQNNEDEQEPEIGFDNDDNDDNNQSYYDEPEADYVEEEPKQNSAADAAENNGN
ncbi:MAG: Rho termination factor N-terminal domain-containing protein, partial [Paludibacteraceae bacterium]|nr:Rho termination factor N-terminal domain-containing protein [Paludibacteraceae bacterium]